MKFVCINNLILLYAYLKTIVHTKLCVFCGLEPYRYCGDTFLHFFLFQMWYCEHLEYEILVENTANVVI